MRTLYYINASPTADLPHSSQYGLDLRLPSIQPPEMAFD